MSYASWLVVEIRPFSVMVTPTLKCLYKDNLQCSPRFLRVRPGDGKSVAFRIYHLSPSHRHSYALLVFCWLRSGIALKIRTTLAIKRLTWGTECGMWLKISDTGVTSKDGQKELALKRIWKVTFKEVPMTIIRSTASLSKRNNLSNLSVNFSPKNVMFGWKQHHLVVRWFDLAWIKNHLQNCLWEIIYIIRLRHLTVIPTVSGLLRKFRPWWRAKCADRYALRQYVSLNNIPGELGSALKASSFRERSMTLEHVLNAGRALQVVDILRIITKELRSFSDD